MAVPAAAIAPATVALDVDGGDHLTYGAWARRSQAIARGLAARGVTRGDPVALLFRPAAWTGFACAYVGVQRAGARAVLVTPGVGDLGLARAMSRSGAAGLIRSEPGAEVAGGAWCATVTDLEQDPNGEDRAPPAGPPADPPAGPPHSGGDRVADGWLVHAWAPGSPASTYVLETLLSGERGHAATSGVFDPDRFCALVAGRGATECGLTPALAAALVASEVSGRHDLATVRRVLLSAPASTGLAARLQEVFPYAEVAPLDDRPAGTDGLRVEPVAPSQEGMLWHEQFTPGSFNLPCLVRRYQGNLDRKALEWALSELIRRHEPLRTTFDVSSGDARQVVHDARPVDLAPLDLAGLAPGARDAHIARLLTEATSRPFDLAQDPLFDPRLVRLGPDDHLLVVRLHHTVFDDWSVDVFRRELSALYTAALAGEPSPLVEPSTTFAEFCRGQQAELAGDAGAAERSWWRHELRGAPLSVQLPIGRPGRAEPGEPLRLDLPAELARELRALAPKLRATPFMTVLAAFSVLVSRLTGQDDLLIATVVANRNRRDLEPLIGCFTKKVPLRLRVEGDPTFAELVARTRASFLGALAHQDLAFDAAVQEALAAPAAEHGVVPQVSVVFQAETPQTARLTLPGLSVSRYEVPAGARRERHFTSGPDATGSDGREGRAGDGAGASGAATDGEGGPQAWGDGIYLGTFLILSLAGTTDGMALLARGVFDRPAGRRLLEEFRALLTEVVASPDRRICELAPPRAAPTGDDLVELRGFRASRSRLESALARCPGVAEVALAVRREGDGEPRLVAYVVPQGDDAPTLTELRHGLWASLPGAIWPAAAVTVGALPRRRDGSPDLTALPPPASPGVGAPPDAVASLLAVMWAESARRPAGPDTAYWQDFSFLPVLAEARDAGLALSEEHVVRCRTPETLAAAVAAARRT